MNSIRRTTAWLLLFFIISLYVPLDAYGAATYDHTAGTYSNDLADSTGITATSSAKVHTDGSVHLTNGSGVVTSPYQSSGTLITSTIIPTYLAEWGTITFNASTTASTSVKVQVLDAGNNTYSNTLLPGNVAGFTDSTVDISALPIDRLATNDSGKFGGIRLKFTLSTTDTSVSPALHDFTLTWTTRQGSMASTTLATTAWAIAEGNAQATNHVNSAPDSSYRVLRWSIDQGNDYGGQTVIGSNNLIYNKTQGGTMDGSSFAEGTLSAIDKRTGETDWSRDISGFSYSDANLTLGANGDLYNVDIFHDRLMAYDSSGTPKWTYNFGSGHGNQHVNIGPNGQIYLVHTNDDSFTAYAFNANGTVAWSANTNPPNNVSVPSTSLDSDGSSLYVGSSIISGFTNTGAGKLYSLDTSDGTTEWSYDTGDIGSPLVGDDGTIYTYSSNSASFRKRITALNADGTLKWERSLGTTTDYWARATLTDEALIVERANSTYPSSGGLLEGVSLTDGSVLWTETISNQPDVFGSGLYSDSSGYMVRPSVYTSTTSLVYYNNDQDFKWKWEYPTASKRLAFTTPDADGGIYTTLYDESGRGAELLGFAPWSLSVTSPDYVARGDSMEIEVTTNMPATDPLSGAANAMQAVMSDGTKVALSHESSSSGVSTWSGTYTIPESSESGAKSFTVEAAAAYTVTDTAVNFTSVPSYSGNTGISTSASYTVELPIQTGSRGGGGSGAKDPVVPTVPKNSTTTATTTPANNTLGIVQKFLALGIKRGETHPFVMELQRFLNQNGFTVTLTGPGSAGQETNYFGPATERALNAYLVKESIQTPGNLFTKTLRPGMSDKEVKELQKFLNKNGFTVAVSGPGSAGLETEFYGPATARAVSAFQEKYAEIILKPLGFSKGTGIFGNATRAHANSLIK